MTKKLPITYVALFTLLINTTILSAQNIPSTSGKEYVIGDIKVTGITTYNENTVVTFTGLKKGERILLPGDRISKILKKLWNLPDNTSLN